MGLNCKTAIVVPCYNETKRLNCKAFEHALANDQNLEIVFVNDGSSDNTGDILNGVRQRAGQRTHVIHLQHNSGKAEAVRQGVLRAFDLGAKFIGYWDADLATPLNCIELFAHELDARGVSLILGSRVHLMGRNIERRAFRHYIGRGFATLAAFSLGFPVYDTQCGAKLFRAIPVFREAFARSFELNWAFDVELLRRLRDARNSEHHFDVERECIEFPLPQWIDAPGSKLNLAQYPKIMVELAKLTIQRLSSRRM
jgi:dolichyl-phosphate beta-glucosyltransferase